MKASHQCVTPWPRTMAPTPLTPLLLLLLLLVHPSSSYLVRVVGRSPTSIQLEFPQSSGGLLHYRPAGAGMTLHLVATAILLRKGWYDQ